MRDGALGCWLICTILTPRINMNNSLLFSRTPRQATRFKRALSSLVICLITVLDFVASSSWAYADNDHDRQTSDRDPHQKWVATWATSPATFFVYVPPVAPIPPGPPA